MVVTRAVSPKIVRETEVEGCVAEVETDWLKPFDQDEEEKKQEEERSKEMEDGSSVPGRVGHPPGKVKRGEEGARMRRIGDPRLPSDKEVEEHYLTHVPYRN